MKAQQFFNEDPKNPMHRQMAEVLKNTGFGDGATGKPAGNHAGVILDAHFTSANVATDFTPRLGRTPVFVFTARPPNTQGASLRYHSMDSTKVTLSCNVANTDVKLY